ncbi:CARDB domain-containing protein [Haloarcula onubensis]|uniref:CARDB domain-containing protein n=1 Tax=Haloarcula onubensis TaxID=2950539 RepID=A0ABU2FR13_9EURY|nr:CARDB domain-containing protein [Halomicroarcula sp. S3CR25-11]MDS0283198.1 hypothetical protein [Halomicroarcula sp. S3CR25-11]
MSEALLAELDGFETQLTDGRYGDAEATLSTIADLFAETERETTRVYARSLAAGPVTDAEETLAAYNESAATIDLQRGQFLLQASSFLSAPDAFDRSELVSVTESLQEAERTTTERRTEAATALESVTVPARPAIIEIAGRRRLPVGEQTTFEIRVENVGDEETPPLSLAASAGDTLALGSTTHDIGRLSGSSGQTVTVTVTGSSAGESALSVAVTSDGETAAADSATVVVTDQGTPTPSGGDSAVSGLPLAGAAGLGALGGGAALYRYLSKGSETDETEE